MRKTAAHTLVYLSLLFIMACDPNQVYENFESIPDNTWEYAFKPSFEVEIKDTTVLHNMFITVRHTNWYPYTNLYVFIVTTYPSGETKKDRVKLALGNEKDWFGKGMGDIWDIMIPIQEKMYFPEVGKYKFELEQNMREEKIPGIMDIGIRIERTEEEKEAS